MDKRKISVEIAINLAKWDKSRTWRAIIDEYLADTQEIGLEVS